MVAHVNLLAANTMIARLGMGADGVVRVQIANALGSGVLLYDGRHVLTARHLFEGAGATPAMSVTFETESGVKKYTVDLAKGMKNWDVNNVANDLVLLTLETHAPLDAERYTLYRENDEIRQDFVMVGYGVAALGNGHAVQDDDGVLLRRYATNRFDGEMSSLKLIAGNSLSWNPPKDSQLWADFDNGLLVNDATQAWTGSADYGRGLLEGMITSGDSGGPAFINGQVAGISSYTFRSLSNDIDDFSNGSFGEIGVWQRISSFEQWIDQNIRASYIDAPTTSGAVKTAVPEGNQGTSHAYFLLEMLGVRVNPTQTVRMLYATRDGTAKAGEDYVATQGVLNIYPDENKVVIAVEIIGDSHPEPDETFYLDMVNVAESGMPAGSVQLTAMRTILNDDGLFLG